MRLSGQGRPSFPMPIHRITGTTSLPYRGRQMLTQERLKEVLLYNHHTGVFTSRSNDYRRRGKKKLDQGYVRIRIDDGLFRAHRLAWLYVTGAWPKHELDHINGVRHDNRWANLREAPRSMNMQNIRGARRNNKTGFLGISPHWNKFRAKIVANGKRYDLGLYPTAEEANEAYLKAKRKLHQGNML